MSAYNAAQEVSTDREVCEVQSRLSILLERAELVQEEVGSFVSSGSRVFISSSFQTHSIPLLHIVTQVEPAIPVVFVDTGYHFPETLVFVQKVAEVLGLNLQIARSERPKADQLDSVSRLLFVADPDRCCQINKVEPLRDYLNDYDVWISGLRADQSDSRRDLPRLTQGPLGTKKYLPLIDWTSQNIELYREYFELPAHPLDLGGQLSIGCEPCTDVGPVNLGMPLLQKSPPRDSRWFGMEKTECGLHLASGFESSASKQ